MMTITEKIIAAHCGLSRVKPGEIVQAQVDMAMGTDAMAPLILNEFARIKNASVFDKNKVALIPDHFTPSKDIATAGHCMALRQFARKHDIQHYYEVGRVGIEHIFLPEQGIVQPGQLVVGSDSHTVTYGAVNAFSTGMGATDIAAAIATGKVWLRVPETHRIVLEGKLRKGISGKDIILYLIGRFGTDGFNYKAIEFAGPALKDIPMSGRLTISNMVIEGGAKNGIFPYDDITAAFVTTRVKQAVLPVAPDHDAVYAETSFVDISELHPQVALPYSPGNVKAVKDVKRVKVDQVVIGSCTNGHLDDLRAAAEVLKDQVIHRDVRMIVVPATQDIYLDAIREGLVEIFIKAGAVVSTPTCGPCCGGHMGVLGPRETCVSTTNRNFIGRMGHRTSEVYLVNPSVAAATGIAGQLALPEEV